MIQFSALGYCRYTLRRIRKNPALTLTVILLPALGIGANVAVFSIINAFFLAPLPVHEPESLVALQNVNQQGHSQAFSYPMLKGLRGRQDLLSGLVGWSTTTLSFDRNDVTLDSSGLLVTGDFFGFLGVKPLLGRAITPEDVATQASVALVSYGFWKRQFGLDPNILGREVRIQQSPVTVIGVTPPEFFGLDAGLSFDLVLPISFFQLGNVSFESAKILWLNLWGRLKPTVSIGQAEAGLQTLWPQILQESVPPDFAGQRRASFLVRRLEVVPAGRGLSPLRELYSQPLFILMGLIGLMLFIACFNAANLLLIRTIRGVGDVAVRMALGAKPSQLMVQGFTETLLLAAVGGVLALLFAHWMIPIFLSSLTIQGVTPELDLQFDHRVAAFAALAIFTTAIVVGLLPSLKMSHLDPGAILRGGLADGGKWMPSWRWEKILVILQVALLSLLTVVASSFVQSLRKLTAQDLGFKHENLLMVRLRSQGRTTTRDFDFASYYQQLLQKVESLPGVRTASLIHPPPLVPIKMDSTISVAGYTPGPNEDMSADRSYVAPGFPETIGTRLVSGRALNLLDNERMAKVALINEAMARRFFPRGQAVGGQFRLDRNLDEEIHIVGVVKDAKYRDIRQRVPAAFYLASLQYPYLSGLTLLVRTDGKKPGGIAKAVSQGVLGLGIERPLTVTTMSQHLDSVLSRDRSLAMLSSLVGFLALLLTTVGVYGIVAFKSASRTREFGIRVALGARPTHIHWLVLRESLVLVLVGVAAGVAAGIALTVLLGSLVYGLEDPDLALFALSAGLVIAVSMAASYFPAAKASRRDPMLALRQESF